MDHHKPSPPPRMTIPLSDLTLHSPSTQFVGTPFTSESRFEYPFPDTPSSTSSSHSPNLLRLSPPFTSSFPYFSFSSSASSNNRSAGSPGASAPRTTTPNLQPSLVKKSKSKRWSLGLLPRRRSSASEASVASQTSITLPLPPPPVPPSLLARQQKLAQAMAVAKVSTPTTENGGAEGTPVEGDNRNTNGPSASNDSTEANKDTNLPDAKPATAAEDLVIMPQSTEAIVPLTPPPAASEGSVAPSIALSSSSPATGNAQLPLQGGSRGEVIASGDKNANDNQDSDTIDDVPTADAVVVAPPSPRAGTGLALPTAVAEAPASAALGSREGKMSSMLSNNSPPPHNVDNVDNSRFYE